MLATPESVDSSRASPESGVFAAEVLVLEPSLGNEKSPTRRQNPLITITRTQNYTYAIIFGAFTFLKILLITQLSYLHY
jgi:hypothetical protein